MIQLTERDIDLLQTLACRVRLLTLRQAARLGWPCSPGLACARRRLMQLSKAGLVELHRINALPAPTNPMPLFQWSPGMPMPDARSLADTARRRWACAAMPTDVCVASPLAANLWGSVARGLPPQDRRTHDLCLAVAYVHYRQYLPELASGWTGDHARPKAPAGDKNPDALLCDHTGKPIRAIESLGSCGSRRIEAFHQHCESQDLPYELW